MSQKTPSAALLCLGLLYAGNIQIGATPHFPMTVHNLVILFYDACRPTATPHIKAGPKHHGMIMRKFLSFVLYLSVAVFAAGDLWAYDPMADAR
ncbi:MAG: hypothetical protein QGF09_07860, partial [Rhodospirillales bacterium]|nr:hypothetical protein [Rhodospirillales bacterium]